MNLKKKISFTFILLLFFSGCKRYVNDDSFVTLKTAKGRISGKWQLDRYLINDNDSTSAYKNLLPTLLFTINRDGSYTRYCDCFKFDKTGKKVPFMTDEKGSWQLTEKKEYFAMSPGLFGSAIKSYKILKLSKKQFWYQEDNGVMKIEYHFYK